MTDVEGRRSRTTSLERVVRYLLPSFGAALFSGALAYALFGTSLFRGDGDVGRHLRVGHDILASGRIAGIDVYSHTMRGQPFVPYEWLSEVAAALADRAAGLAGVATLSAVLFALATWLAYRLARLAGGGPLLAGFAAALAMVLQAIHLLPRPHLFTTLLAVSFLYALEKSRRAQATRILAILPIGMCLWANLHGGFLVGFILLAVYLVDAWRPGSPSARMRRPLLIVTVACIAASLLTPVGLSLWAHTTGYLGIDFLVDRTNEYQSPDFHAAYGRTFLAILILGIALLATGRASAYFVETTLFVGWLAAALHSGRNIPLFGVLAVPWYAAWIRRALATGQARDEIGITQRLLATDTRLVDTERRLRPIGVGILMASLLLAIALFANPARYRFQSSFFPVAALQTVPEGGPRPDVFNDMAWGGYLLYERPDIPVFMDGQTDFYGADLAMDYVAIMNGEPRWQEKLDEYGVGWTLTRPGATLVQLLEASGGWTRLYGDSVAVVLVRGPYQHESVP
jgi:hypothetical protein